MHNYEGVNFVSFQFFIKITLVKYFIPLGTTTPESDACICFMLSDAQYLGKQMVRI